MSRAVSFEQWASGAVRLGGRAPTAADLDVHLTTLFPPVRLRGYLELRYLDMTRAALVARHRRGRDHADGRPGRGRPGHRGDRARPPRCGPRRPATAWADAALADSARRCVAIAADRAPAALAPAVADLAELVESGRCPGDLLAERIAEIGPQAAFEELAHAMTRRRPRPGAGPRPHPRADRPGRADAAGPARPADEPAGLGPGPHRPAGGAVAAARRRPGPARHAAARRRLAVRRVQAPAGRPAGAAAAAARRGPGLRPRGPRPGARPAGAHARRRTCSPRAWSCSTRSSTTRPCSPRCSCGRDRRSCWPRRPLPPGRPVAGRARASWPAARSCSASTRPAEPFSLDNERPAHTVDVGPVLDRPGAGEPTRQWREFIADGGYHRPDLWSERGWAHRIEAGLERPQFWTAERHPAPLRDRGGRAAGRAGAARLLLRGRGVRPAGAAPGCRPRSSGRRPAPGIRPPAPGGRWPWGSLAARPRSWPTWAACGLRPAPVGAYPAQRVGLRRRAADRRRVGVDVVGLPARGPASRR